MDWFLYEKEAAQKGYSAVCGIDEAGRGPLAGPVFAAAVILPAEVEIPGLNDSKKLTERQRYALREVVERDALAWAVGIVLPEEIDKINILIFIIFYWIDCDDLFTK